MSETTLNLFTNARLPQINSGNVEFSFTDFKITDSGTTTTTDYSVLSPEELAFSTAPLLEDAMLHMQSLGLNVEQTQITIPDSVVNTLFAGATDASRKKGLERLEIIMEALEQIPDGAMVPGTSLSKPQLALAVVLYGSSQQNGPALLSDQPNKRIIGQTAMSNLDLQADASDAEQLNAIIDFLVSDSSYLTGEGLGGALEILGYSNLRSSMASFAKQAGIDELLDSIEAGKPTASVNNELLSAVQSESAMPSLSDRPTSTSEAGIELIKEFEGFRSSTYYCSAGVLTIGYGTTNSVPGVSFGPGHSISRQQAEDWLKLGLEGFEQKVLEETEGIELNQNEFDALVSFVYNVGPNAFENSTLLRLLQAGAPREQVAEQFHAWVNAGGRPLEGLVRRREAEAELFLKG